MAGGKGTRFWPESRAKRPKPFLRLLGKTSLLEETVSRITPLIPPSRILLVLQDELAREARRLLPRIPRENILGEPIGKNTAPCTVYAAAHIRARDPEAKFAFLPADQLIRPRGLFVQCLKTAFEIVDDRPVLFGIQPRWPAPSYGYLEVGGKSSTKGKISVFTITRFHEKPSLAKAKKFLRKGNFLWNGGMFIWRLDAFKKAVRTHAPKLYPAFEKLSSLPKGGANKRQIAQVYARVPSISIDYAIMEKMKNVHCLLAPLEWSDLGGWIGLSEFWPSDRNQNRIQGKPLLIKARGNIVKGSKRLIALLGVENFLVVDTPDALLICPRSEAEHIREVVHELERRKAYLYL